MYLILLGIFLYCSALTAADVGPAIPKTLDEVPAYGVQFLKRIVKEPLESDLLSLVDDWEDNMSLFGWNDGDVTDVLFEAAHSVSDSHTPNELLAMSKRALGVLYGTAITNLQASWKEAPLEQFPIPFKNPDKWSLFVNEQKHVSECDGFIRFLIARLGMQGEANCRSLCGVSRWDKKSYFWVKKESLERFQELFKFDLRLE